MTAKSEYRYQININLKPIRLSLLVHLILSWCGIFVKRTWLVYGAEKAILHLYNMGAAQQNRHEGDLKVGQLSQK